MDTLSILLERESNGFRASVLGLPDCQAIGHTREEALANIQSALNDRLQSAEIITIPHHSSALTGLFKDDPQWDEFQAAIVQYRQTTDAELAAEYDRMNDADISPTQKNSAA
jgi:predicted RNase H-like HicB family nuclease